MSDQSRTVSDSTDARARTRPVISWQLLIVLGALALTALLFWHTSRDIAVLWQDTNVLRYRHGWAVLAVTVWLIWRGRAALAAIPLAPPAGGWLLVGLGAVGWLVLFNAGLQAPAMLALPLIVLAAIWSAGGWRIAKWAAFPVLYLYFALPAWDFLDLPLQSLTTDVSLWLVRQVGIPATTDGHVIHIPAGWFEVEEACNGLHFFVVALAIAAVHGEIDDDSLGSRLLLMGLAGLLAMATNWVRVFIVIVAGHATNMQHFLVRVDHYYFGWFLFAFTLIFYVYLSSRIPRRKSARKYEGSAKASVAATAPKGKVVTATVLSAIALSLGPLWAQAVPRLAAPLGDVAPPNLAGWTGPTPFTGDWRPVFENPDREWLVAYRSEPFGEAVLYRAIYRYQRQGRELRAYDTSDVGSRYRVTASRDHEVSAGNRIVPVSEQAATGPDGKKIVVWSMYTVDGRPNPMRLPDQLAYGARSLFGAPPASVIAFAAECRPDCEHARAALGSLAAQALPVMLAAAPGPN